MDEFFLTSDSMQIDRRVFQFLFGAVSIRVSDILRVAECSWVANDHRLRSCNRIPVTGILG